MSGPRESGSPRAPATAKLGAVFLFAGLGFDLVAALVCGVALLTLAGGAVAWVGLSTRRGRLELLPGPARIQETDPYPLRLRLRGTLLPPIGGELTHPLLDRSIPVGPRWSRRLDRHVWLKGPGRRPVGTARLIVRDPLGLWERQLESERIEELVVLPRIDPVRWAGEGPWARGRSAGSGSASDASAPRGGLAQFEVDGLRPYRDGSPASRIHWPAVARTGQMIERRLVAGGEPRPLVVFDPRGERDPSQRERAMRATASLCVALARSGGCDLLLPGGRRALTIDPALRSWPEAHVRLAVSDAGASPAVVPRMAGGAVLWVTAGRTPPSSVRRLQPGSFLVTPIGSRRTAAFRVSGCFGYPAATERLRAPSRSAAA